MLFDDTTVEALAGGAARAAARRPWDCGAHPAPCRTVLARRGSCSEIQHVVDDTLAAPAGAAMVRRHNRLLVAFHVATDAVLGMVAFFLAYLLRFETGLIAITRGQPPLEQYLNVLPFIALIVPLGFHLQGLYRLRRGRSRIDDFFNVLVGSIFAVVLGVVATLYFQALLRHRGAARRRRLRSVAHRLGHLPRLQHRARLPVAQVHPRSARAALARGHRPAPDPDRRRRRSRPRGRGSHPRASRARLSDRRLRRRQGRRRSSRLSRAAAARLAQRRRRHRHATRRSTTSTSRCRSKST